MNYTTKSEGADGKSRYLIISECDDCPMFDTEEIDDMHFIALCNAQEQGWKKLRRRHGRYIPPVSCPLPEVITKKEIGGRGEKVSKIYIPTNLCRYRGMWI